MKNMLSNSSLCKMLLLGLFCAVTILSACRKSDATSDLSGTYEISLQKTIDLPKNGKKATLTFVDFNDSRCPVNANCVTAGSAFVNVVFKDGLINESIQLCLGVCTDKEKIITSNGLKYSLSLIELTPYPQTYIFVSTPAKITVVVKKV